MKLPEWLARAARLTRDGDLRAATSVIQQALQRRPAAHAEGRTAPPPHTEPQRAGAPHAEPPLHAPRPAPADGPGGMQRGRHADAHGALDYALYAPPQAGRGAPLPLVVMLHGCTQDAGDFAAGTAMNALARGQGCWVLYPEQAQRANAQRCWNWFQRGHQQRDRGEPALIAALVRDVMARHRIDPARVYVAGLSAGGAMAAIVGAAYPELFAAVGVHSGLPAGAATNLPAALAAMRNGSAADGGPWNPSDAAPAPPTIVFHGDADVTVHPGNGEQVALASARAHPAGADAVRSERVERPGERAATRRVWRGADGRVVAEHWLVHGAPHAWSGGSTQGSFTDPQGPDASAEMLRFFLEHPRAALH